MRRPDAPAARALTWEDVEVTLHPVLDEDMACDAAMALKEAGFAVLSNEETGLAIDGLAQLVSSSPDSEYRPLLHKLQAVYATRPREDDRG